MAFVQNVKTLALQTLGVIIGLFTTFLSALILILMDHHYAYSRYRINVARNIVYLLENDQYEDTKKVPFETIDFWGRDVDIRKLPPEEDSKVQKFADAIMGIYVVVLFLLILYIFSSLLLIFGSVKKINFFKWPWIILTFYILIGCLVGIILRYGLF